MAELEENKRMDMKAKLEFDLPADLYAFKCASVAQDLAHAVVEVDRLYRQFTRNKTEKEPIEVLQEMHDAVRELSWQLEQG